MLGAAWAQAPNCAPYDEVTKQLRENYGERLIGQGTMQGGQLIHQVFVNPETRTWTVVILTTGKRACVVATGENWMIPSVAEPEGAPS